MRRAVLKNLIALVLLTACSSDALGPADVASPAGLDVSLAVPTLSIGQTTQALATLRDAAGHSVTVAGGDAVTWASSNPAIATITPATGMVTAVSPGTTLISASAAGKTASATLTVFGDSAATGSVSAVRLSMTSATLGLGQNAPATATVLDAAGNVTTTHALVWTSSSTNVALVSQAGVITGVSAGTSTITATSEGVSGTLLVTVGAVPVSAVVVELTPGAITVNGSSRANAIVKDAGGNVLTDRTATWTTSNADVATVAQDGTVKGVASGLANITAAVDGVNGSATIAVGTAPVATVATTLKPQLFVGERTQAAAALSDAAGNNVTGRDVAWVSSNPSVAAVNGDGVVTGIAAGTAMIAATSEGKSGSVPLSVVAITALAPTTVNVTLSASTIGATDIGTATATVLDQAGNPITGQTVAWASSNPSVATINPSTGVYAATGAGTTTIRASVGSSTGSAALTVVASGPTHLAFTTQPGGAVSGVNLTSQPVVQILDASNAVVGSSTATVTASIISGSGTLVGTKSVAAVNGVAMFTDLKINGPSTDRLLFTSSGLSPMVSSPITVTQVPASVVIRRQPSDGGAGAVLSTQPQVQVLDNAGYAYASSSLTIIAGVASGRGTLSGTTSVNTLNGVATFNDLAVNGTGTFVLAFGMQSPLLGVAANPITISGSAPATPSQPTKISITTPPVGGVSGSVLATQPVVELRDANNMVTSSTANVTVTVSPGTLSGTTTVAAVNGVATFTDLVVAGTGLQTLTFTASGLSPVTSTSFSLTAPTGPQAAQLAVTRQPAGAVSGVALTTQPRVELRTAAGDVATSSTAAVTATLIGSGGTLSGTTTVNAINGVARFTNLRVSGGGQYSLSFSAAGLTSSPSDIFTSTQNAASLSVSTQPSGAVSGSVFGTQPVVRILDDAGLLIATGANSTLTITASRNAGSASLAGTTSVAAVGGIATFTDLSLTGQGIGTHSLLFAATLAGISTTSSNFTVAAGAPVKLSVATQPVGAILGTVFGTQPVVRIIDANGNQTSSTTTVTAAIGRTTAGGTLAGTLTVAAVNGAATFTDLAISAVSGSYTLVFSSPGLSPIASTTFAVSAGSTGGNNSDNGNNGNGSNGNGNNGNSVGGTLASADFENGTYGTNISNETPGHNAIVADPTNSGHGKVLQITYSSATGAGADLNQFVSFNPTSGLGHGSTTYFSGDVYFPANTANFADGGVLRKLTYWRTNIQNNGQCDFVLFMFGNELGVSVTTPQHTTTKYNAFAFQMGQWYNVRIQVTMNSAPGVTDGITRVWINGALVYEKLNEQYTDAGDPSTTRWNWLTAGHQREGSSSDSSINELRYWDNLVWSTGG